MPPATAGCDLDHIGRTMFCEYCGTKTKEGAKFCGACGKPIAVEASPRVEKPPDPPPPHPETRSLGRERIESTAGSVPSVDLPPKREIFTEQGGSNGNRLVLPLSIAAVVLIAAVVVSLRYFKIDSKASIYVPKAAPASPVLPHASAGSPLANAVPHVASSVTPNAASPTSGACFDLSKREPHSLEGKLVSVIFPDRPSFSDVRTGDDPVEGYLLQLETAICIQGGDENAGPNPQFSEVQLYPEGFDLKTEATMRSLVGFNVRVELASVKAEENGHDHRPLVAGVGSIAPMDTLLAGKVIPRTLSQQPYSATQDAETGTAATTVRGFYYALGQGNGGASDFVIPEKRVSGPFSPEGISRFYGPLPEPLSLVELKPQGPGEYLVSYTYATSARRCQGRALVKTTQRDDLNLIEKIHPLDGC